MRHVSRTDQYGLMSQRERYQSPAELSCERRLILARIERLARLLDTAYRIPGTRIRFGLDPLLGLLPVVGDIGGAALSAYLIYEARRLKLPKSAIARMIGNVAVEAALGAIPLAGDMFDLFWRANMRNLRILHRHMEHMEKISKP